MNLRILLAGALAGLVLFIWLGISWAALPFHMENFNGIAHSARLDALLLEMGAQPGLNYYPGQPEGASRQEHAELAKSVPGIGIMSFSPEGLDMNSPAPFLMGLLGCIIAALLVAMFIQVLPPTAGFVGKVLFCTMFGVAAFFCTHWVNGGFFYFPIRALFVDLMDGIIGWSLAGFVLAAMIRSRGAAAPHESTSA